MKSKTITKTTTNRGEFNRAYKFYLEQKSRIHCSYCGYHRGENLSGKKCYGGYSETSIRHPNWKLVSKQPKQWMKKPIKKVIEYYGGYQRTYVEIKFST
jgi:hypothetical protein